METTPGLSAWALEMSTAFHLYLAVSTVKTDKHMKTKVDFSFLTFSLWLTEALL